MAGLEALKKKPSPLFDAEKGFSDGTSVDPHESYMMREKKERKERKAVAEEERNHGVESRSSYPIAEMVTSESIKEPEIEENTIALRRGPHKPPLFEKQTKKMSVPQILRNKRKREMYRCMGLFAFVVLVIFLVETKSLMKAMAARALWKLSKTTEYFSKGVALFKSQKYLLKNILYHPIKPVKNLSRSNHPSIKLRYFKLKIPSLTLLTNVY